MTRSAIGCFVIFLAAGGVFAAEAPTAVAEPTLRRAATKPLQLIQKAQRVWYRNTECTSCHHQLLPALVEAAARDRGVPFDTKYAREVTTRSFSRLKDLDSIAQGYDYIDEVDEAWRLVAAHAAGVPPSLSVSANAQFLASAQRPDGSWYTMDGRPPQSYSRFTATAVCALAVRHYLPEQFKDQRQEVLRRAGEWFRRAEPRTTEERVFRLLGLFWTAPEAKGEIEKATRHLVAEQRDDGGWSQLPRLGSDAYSTGEALYALNEAGGLKTGDPAYQRGLRFLLKSQQEDGSWRVESRLDPSLPGSPEYFGAGFPHGRLHQYASLTGTSWAAVAVLKALPAAPGKKPPAGLPDFRPAEKGEWARVALDGSAAELKAALAGGMSPNAKTARGTTALMLAARNPAKAKLLLDRGADAGARAESGIDALIVAARYHGGSDVVRLLLKHGAKPNAPKGVKVRNGVTALFHAATCGDAASARALLHAGAAVDSVTEVLGNFRMTPLVSATLRGDTPMVELLLRHGANPNGGGNRENISPLHRAVINNHPETVQALLAGGARINHADTEGFTALHYATITDLGDTAVLKKLIASGADLKARNAKGQTPWDLARPYQRKAITDALAAKP